MIDTDSLLAHVDLPALIAADLGPGRKSGRWVLWRCPFHADDTPSLGADDKGRWHCFGCGKSGDAITWVIEREGLGFREACERLGAGEYQPTQPRPVAPQPDRAGPPAPKVQEQMRAVLAECQPALWGKHGRLALEYLTKRGLQPDTLQFWRVGFNPTGRADLYGREIAGLYVPRGIVIPCEMGGVYWYLKVRLVPGVPFECSDCKRVLNKPGKCPHCRALNKYRGVRGNRAALFGAGYLTGQRRAIFTEGELDAMLLEQEAGDLAGVVTLASASNGLDSRQWGRYLLPLSPWLLAYDLDGAGKRGADKLAWLTGRARRLTVPQLRPSDKDLTDFHLSGGNLRAWLAAQLASPETTIAPAAG